MILRRLWPMVLSLVLMVYLNSCAVPQKMWPQKDIAKSVVAGTPNAPNILLASRSSEFKVALVDKLSSMMASEGIRLQIVGIEELKTTQIDHYDVIVIISTCLAWGFDAEVQSFIEQHPRHDKMIFVTTSAAGDWMPEKEERRYDAVSSASALANVDAVARNIMSSVHWAFRNLTP